MANVRTYNASVRVGNWYEDCQLEEDTIKNFLERKDRGELLSQKIGKLYETVSSQSQSCCLSTSTDGHLHFGDCVQLKNPGSDEHLVALGRTQPRCPAVLSIAIGEQMLSKGTMPDPSPASADKHCKITPRSIFQIVSVDGTPDGRPVVYGQPFQLRTHPYLGEAYYLMSDRLSFGEAPKKHGHQPVQLTTVASFVTQWKVEYFNPQLRLEFEASPVQVNERIIIRHVKSNQSLAVEEKHTINGLLGCEYDVSANTFFDDHRAEKDVNHWIFVTNVPAGATGECH